MTEKPRGLFSIRIFPRNTQKMREKERERKNAVFLKFEKRKGARD